MHTYEKSTVMEVPSQELFNWHMGMGVFERLIPPSQKVKVLERQGDLSNGGRVVLEMKQGPFTRRWEAVHRDFQEGKSFVDEQVKGPFTQWMHTHSFIPQGSDQSLLKDEVKYQLPFGYLGDLVGESYARKRIEKLFEFRHARTRIDLDRLHPYAGQKPLRVAVTGATGLIGKSLCSFLLSGGHEVIPIVRRTASPGEKAILWSPEKGTIDVKALEGLDAVIHLAGENIGSGRWTFQRKECIFQSRQKGTELLARTLASLSRPPKVLLCSSAIGFYGNRGSEELTETSQSGQGFLTEVCAAWEKACESARQIGIRVVNIRTGIVLTPRGGALAQMLPPFLAGAGGVIGSGQQWMSCISLEDLIGIFHYALHETSLQGPVNATAPQPLTNQAFTKVLGKVLHRPTLFPLPSFMVKLIFGEMGEALLLEGQRVLPEKLNKAGFRFLYPDLETALKAELGK